ncbi:hypothetical protein [Streptomyces sp. NPDC051211]
MHQYEWKPADHGRRTERVGIVVLAIAAALFAAVGIATLSVILVYALA